MVQLEGISYTSILIYGNELLDESIEPYPEKMSHKAKPAKAMVEYIKKKMGDVNDGKEEWRKFPRFLMKAITANTYFFTRMMEMSQYKQIRKNNLSLVVL